MSSSNTTDQSALLAFKFGIKFDPTNVLAHNWTTSTSFCNWIGVTVDNGLLFWTLDTWVFKAPSPHTSLTSHFSWC
ncbi:hypothetical protein CsSME_00008562 [Camellia sinensis var. sinensis]